MTLQLPDYDRFFADGRKLDTPGEPRSPVYLRVRSPGRLVISSGKLVACDPLLAASDTAGFTTPVPAGRFPVSLCVVEYHRNSKRYDERVALARVDFRDGAVVRWALAALPGQKISKLRKDEFLGFGVESGVAAFMDEETARALGAQLEVDEGLEKRVLAALDANYRQTWAWAELPVPGAGNALLFSAGDGAGTYPTFFGYDEKKRLAAALTDFLLIDYA